MKSLFSAASTVLLTTTWLAAQAPPNDNCSNAQVLIGPGIVTGTNVGSTWESVPGNQCGAVAGHKDVWYSYTPAATCLTTVTVCALATNTIIPVLSVFTGTCAGVTHVAGMDVCVSTGSPNGFCLNGLASTNFGAVGGISYLIKVRGGLASQGTFTLTLDCPAAPPQNDTCANPIALADGSNVGFTNLGALTDPLPASCFPMVYDVWFTYTNTSVVTWSVTLDMCPFSSFDSVLAVYSGTCGALNLLACNGNGCPTGLSSRATFVAAPLTTYMIVIGSFGTGWGPPASIAGSFGIEVSHTTAVSAPFGVPCPNPGFPTLTTTLPIINTSFTATLSPVTPSSTQGALFGSAPTTVVTPFVGCNVHLDLATVVLISEWMTPAAPYSFTVLVPNDPSLEFTQVRLQGAVLGPGPVQISNAVALTVGI